MNDFNPIQPAGRDVPGQGIGSFRSSRQRRTATICAVQLPIIIWALCGYALASQLFGLSLWPSLAVAAGCAYVIYLVERLVLSTARTNAMFLARFVLTLLMSALGACVFDLVVFEKDIKVELRAKEAAAYVQQMQPEIERKAAEVQAKEKAWNDALGKANCEADGSCGSGKRSTGPIWRELKRQADEKREDYRAAAEGLEAFKLQVQADSGNKGERAVAEAGVLKRLQALHEYINANKPALAWWVVLFLVIMLLEASVLLAKYAGGKSIEEKLHELREAMTLQRVERHAQMLRERQPAHARLRHARY